MKAQVTIVKSFDTDIKVFTKDYENGDFKEFFEGEGEYVDRLSKLTDDQGKDGEGFTITYTVSVKK